MTDLTSRLLACLERQRAHFASLLPALNAQEHTESVANSFAMTHALEAEFNSLCREWETATVPNGERDRIRAVAKEVAEHIHGLESGLRDLMSRTDEDKVRVRTELRSLERGRGMLRKFGTSTSPEPGYIDRRA